MLRITHLRAAVAAGALSVALVGVTVAGLAGGTDASAAANLTRMPAAIAPGGVVKFAEEAGGNPDYIFAETTAPQQSLANIYQFINLMWPLVYLPNPGQPSLDYNHSMAYPPVWSDNDTVATVTLKHYMWSDGVPVTARDLVFYINLGIAEGTSWGNYSGPTAFPYNLKSYTAVNASTMKFVLKSPINPTYFDDNGIDYITPLPQHAWDKESVNGPVGNYDMTAAGAAKVVAFLQKEAADQSTYTTNPLWKTIDGPFMLKSYGGASSPDIFVPNPAYSGPKPYISEFEEFPYTTDSAEFTSLKAGALDYGYVPDQDFPALGSVKAQGYNTTSVPDWAVGYISLNLVNPQVGPILSQLYIRQALAKLTDQNTMIKHFMDGYGIPTYGPVPVYPLGNPFVSAAEKTNPYPYSVSAAEALLKAHGWQVNAGGVDVCMTAGPAGCGAGVTQGEKLSLSMLYSSGDVVEQEDTDLFQSDAAQAGVQISTRSASFNTVITDVEPCVLPKFKTAPTCTWQLGEFGVLGESTYPSGEGVLNTGGAFNSGSYSNPTLDKYITESTSAPTLQPFYDYENLVVQQAPWIWQPIAGHVAATVKNLAGFGLASEFTGYRDYIEPEFWWYTK